MNHKIKFNSYYYEKEYRAYVGYVPKMKEHNMHTNEHFVVPWELDHDEEKYSAKAKAWE